MSATLRGECYEKEAVLYMALELSNQKWRIGFSDGSRRRQVAVEAGDVEALRGQMERARERLGLPGGCRVVSCYEAGRDGFWLHRWLVESEGVENVVVDASSIEVNRRARRVKTDRLDVESLLRQLMRYVGGERSVWRVVRVPSRSDEARQRLWRERERLLKERTAHRNRIRSLLVTQGVRVELRGDFERVLEGVRLWDGSGLSEDLKLELLREWARLKQVEGQIAELEVLQRERVEAATSGPEWLVKQLMSLRGVGWQSAWGLVMEVFGWRRFRNRRELGACVGLTPSPYGSGDSVRDQGISKVGNWRVRRALIELAWMWLRYQPGSALSRWFRDRWGRQGKRARRVGIVALARKLVIALWRYLETGALPEGAVLGASR